MKILSKTHVNQIKCDIPVPSILINSHEILRNAVEEADRLFRIIVQGPSEAEMWHTGNHIRIWLKNYNISEIGPKPVERKEK